MLKFRSRLGIVLFFFSTVMIASWYIPKVGIRINRTESLPYTLFISREANGNVSNGDYVSLMRPESAIPIMKLVAGLPGDQIETQSGRVLVSGIDHGPISEKLTPIRNQIIPEGHLFLVGQHDESFDSRYSEFGLVAFEELQEVAWPVF